MRVPGGAWQPDVDGVAWQVFDITGSNHMNGTGTRRDSVPIPSGRIIVGPRWHCVWTLVAAERRAADALQQLGWPVYLPLLWDRHESVAVPLFRRYLFVLFDPSVDAWGPIRSARGVFDLLRHRGDGLPIALPPGIVEDLQRRTSARGVVDDPSGIVPARARWTNLTSLSAKERNTLLLQLFGGA